MHRLKKQLCIVKNKIVFVFLIYLIDEVSNNSS